MIFLESSLFNTIKNIRFGFSTKNFTNTDDNLNFNLSFAIENKESIVRQNRISFANAIQINESDIAYQKQIHGDTVRIVTKPGLQGESDAMITATKGIGLAISAADCVPIFIYDPVTTLIAGIHAGWRSTKKEILAKTIRIMIARFGANPENFNVYIGPSISQNNYEIGKEVAEQFDPKFIIQKRDSTYLNVVGINYEILRTFRVWNKNIQLSSLCTYEMKNLLHSYRRDGNTSGRALGIIYML